MGKVGQDTCGLYPVAKNNRMGSWSSKLVWPPARARKESNYRYARNMFIKIQLHG